MRIVFASVLVLLGCSGDPPPAEDLPEPTLQSIQDKVFRKRCSDAGCHGIDFPRQGVALYNSEVSERTMVKRPATIGDAASVYKAIIAPGEPDASFLIAKITTPRPGHGLRMPQGGDALSPQTVEVIRTWIARMPK